MDAELRTPSSPVCLTEGHMTKQETVFWVRCHDRHLQHTTIATNDGEKLFYVDGKGAYRSWSIRRPLKDALGHPVFELRRYGADPKMRWCVEDSNGNKIAELGHKKFFTSSHTAIDARIFSSGALVEMRPRDVMAITNYINIGNATVAEISVHMNNVPTYFVGAQDVSVFRVRVAEAVDLSLTGCAGTMTVQHVPSGPSPAANSKSTTPLGLDATTNKEIAAIWAQVQARVVQLAGGDPKNVKSNLTIDAVLARLDQAQDAREQSHKDKVYSAVRSTFNTTLQFVKTVGGIVAQGASEVFAPTELCFNVVSFVISAWQGYQGIFESLADLLDRCVQYLSRLEYYVRGGMDAKLTKVACQHLQLFVEICDRAIALKHSKRKKLRVFSKILFLDDNDIDDLLQKMASLVDQEGRLVTAQMFSFVSEAVTNTQKNLAINREMDGKIDVLMEDRVDQRKEHEIKRRRDIIVRTLTFDENKLDSVKKEPDPYWQRNYHNYRKAVIPSTGDWIFHDPKYAAWESNRKGRSPILAIKGVEGSGKSYLTSTIIRSLRNRSAAEDSGSRNLVAFYFLEGESKEEVKRTNHLDVIAKAIIWQFVQSDASYLKSVANICERVKDLDPDDIMTQLLFENKDLDRIDATFFIVIDGLGETIGDGLVRFLQKASRLWKDRHIRILLNGHPRAFDQLASVRGVFFQTIPISARNRADVQLFIESRMNDIDALKDTSRMGVPALRQKISDTLCQKTAGDYFKINTILKRISSLDYVNDIDRVLEDAGKERSQQIMGEIEKLNKMRTPKEIAEINEIILWILYGREWFKPHQMAAVLYLKSGELSLLPLETKLSLKYHLFEIDTDGDIDFSSYEIPDLIPEKHKAIEDDLSLDSAKKIHPNEVTIVRHFLHTVCPPEVYSKFDFETFFEQKLSRKGDRIFRDDKDASEIKLALTCLRILTEERCEQSELLRPYAISYLLQHLASVDLAFADREWKSAIGPRLLKLFTDEAAADALLWTDDPAKAVPLGTQIRATWLESEEGVEEVLRWFGDSAVISEISDSNDRAWIHQLVPGPDPKKELLLPFAKRMAVHWVRRPSMRQLAQNAFFFLFDALGKVESRNSNEEGDILDDLMAPKLDKIHEVEEWATQLLEVKEKDSLWEVQVAIVLESFSFVTEAKNRCRRSLELDPGNWRASYYLAHVLDSNSEAIETLEEIVKRFESDHDLVREPHLQKPFAEVLFDLGQRYWGAGNFDLAIQLHTRSIQANYTGCDRALVIMGQYQSQRRWSEILILLETIQQDPTSDVQNLADMMINLAAQERLHEILLRTAVETGQFNLLEEMYESAIKTAMKRQSCTSLYYLRYYYANAVYQQPESEERAIDLWELALKDDLPRTVLEVEDILPDLTRKLAPLYLQRARAAERDSESARTYLERISDMLPDEASENNIVFPSKLYLARYYHVQGDKLRAKQIARSVVKMALEILSDGDWDNDYLAYWRLLLVFLPLGDDKNARTAVIMAGLGGYQTSSGNAAQQQTPIDSPKEMTTREKTPESPRGKRRINEILHRKHSLRQKHGHSPSSSTSSLAINNANNDNNSSSIQNGKKDLNSHSRPRPRPIFAVCDANCGYGWTSASKMWWCRDCINLTFDQDCYQRLKNGTLHLNICDRQHDFLFIPKWGGDNSNPEAMVRHVPKGFVPYGDQIIPLEEWKMVVWREYVDIDVSVSSGRRMSKGIV